MKRFDSSICPISVRSVSRVSCVVGAFDDGLSQGRLCYYVDSLDRIPATEHLRRAPVSSQNADRSPAKSAKPAERPSYSGGANVPRRVTGDGNHDHQDVNFLSSFTFLPGVFFLPCTRRRVMGVPTVATAPNIVAAEQTVNPSEDIKSESESPSLPDFEDNAPPQTSTHQQSIWNRLYNVVYWTPPKLRWDPKNPPEFSSALNVLFAFAGAFTVANLYYNHPILNVLAADFQVPYGALQKSCDDFVRLGKIGLGMLISHFCFF
jgi:hypothetical protein